MATVKKVKKAIFRMREISAEEARLLVIPSPLVALAIGSQTTALWLVGEAR